MSKVSIKGVVVGGIVDIFTSFVLGIPLVIYAVSRVDLSHTPKDQIKSVVAASLHGNVSLYTIQLIVGLACSALGGYVAAWLAKHHEVLNGGLSSFLCVAIGIYSISAGKDSHSLFVQVLLIVASPMFASIGGYVMWMQRQHRLQPA